MREAKTVARQLKLIASDLSRSPSSPRGNPKTKKTENKNILSVAETDTMKATQQLYLRH